MFEKWNKDYPPTKDEIKRAKKIMKIQGNSNPYVSKWQNYVGL